ncbi:hypothetical protein [Riemerella columbina]|uniref:hypothetical protein n=1 Tax=Riemerella columbina TaxID=103810 RepID=UPI00036D2479|nr:hypothetical protein [Riemerella columbina]
MKYILEFILITIIIFFVWNTLKRLFFNKFYNYFPHQKKQNQQQRTEQQRTTKRKKETLNWDAETVEYEEIKD